MLDYMNHFFYLLDDLNLVTPIFFFTFVTPVTHYLPEKKIYRLEKFRANILKYDVTHVMWNQGRGT